MAQQHTDRHAPHSKQSIFVLLNVFVLFKEHSNNSMLFVRTGQESHAQSPWVEPRTLAKAVSQTKAT
jgi:hypothetical protein